jgi:hypothetical protein
VIQRRIQPVTELFPTEEQTLEPWLISWGVFTMACGFGGVFSRGNTIESNVEVINVSGGAFSGSALYAKVDDE